MLKVELACAVQQEVVIISLQLPEGSTVHDAIRQSGILDRYPQLSPLTGSTGIYGKLCTEDTVLKEGDRVEIYSPLRADPKEARRNRAIRRSKSAS